MNTSQHTFPASAALLLVLAAAQLSHAQPGAAPAGIAPAIPFDITEEQCSIRRADFAMTYEKVWEIVGAIQLLRRADGMLWVTAASGLYRFDGNDARVFIEPLNKPEARLSNWLLCAAEDEHNTLWLGSQFGFKRFNDVDGTFESFLHDSASPGTISHNFVSSLCADRKGHIWIGTPRGLNRFDIRSRTFTRFLHDPHRDNALVCDTVVSVAAGSDGVIWAGTLGGLSRYDPLTGVFTNYSDTSPAPFRLPARIVRLVYAGKDGLLWIATGAGLSVFDFNRGTSRLYVPRRSDSTALPEAAITSMTEDGLGNLWLGTNAHGLIRLDRASQRFVACQTGEPAMPNVMQWSAGLRVAQRMQSVLSTAYDEPGASAQSGEPRVLWVNADRAIWRVTVVRPLFSRVTVNAPAASFPLPIGRVIGESKDHVWLHREEGSLGRLDFKTLQFRTYRSRGAAYRQMSFGSVAVAGDGTAYVATTLGAVRIDTKRRTFVRLPALSRAGPLLAGRDGSIWFATPNPQKQLMMLGRYDPVSGRVRTYPRDLLPGESRTGGGVITLRETKDGDIWYGTFGRIPAGYSG